jgi:hypothetical protein
MPDAAFDKANAGLSGAIAEIIRMPARLDMVNLPRALQAKSPRDVLSQFIQRPEQDTILTSIEPLP